ncbi:HD domain-containing protein [Streptomyces eurythermus]
MLHRQALYLASYDRGPDAAAWTAHTLHRRRDMPARRGWSPRWAEARSTATALALLGDPQPLLDFIDRALADDTHKGTASFISEMGVLKRVARTGWWFTGNKQPGSVAEHSFRVGVIGSVLAMMEGVDPAWVALLCLFHDSQETRVGDIPHIGRKYIKAALTRR